MLIGDWILLALAAIVCMPLLVIGIEALASLFPQPRPTLSGTRPGCVVLIPAHDEASGIGTTIRNVREQTSEIDRILVVADNCTDNTAEIARAAGCDVIERIDAANRGKGFALDAGLQSLRESPPAIVVVVDADCELGAGALDALVRQAIATGRPAQGVYLIGTGQEDDLRRKLSAFAVLLKNKIRPSGLNRLGLPCLLTGTGMAFPWLILKEANLGTGNIVEDMKLGVDLALAGYPAKLCPSASLSGAAAPDRRSTIKQRTRWEHGHVQTLVRYGPRLILAGLFRCRVSLVGLGLELSVPPLSLVCLAWFLTTTACLVSWLVLHNSCAPLACCICSLAFTGITIFAGWMKYGRKMLPFTTLLQAPLYILWKIPIYVKMAIVRERRWERTDRASAQK